MRTPTGTERIQTNQNALSTTAEKIASISAGRHRVVVYNIDAAISVYVGPDSGVTASTGFLVKADYAVPFYTKGELWAIAASGTPTVCVMEED